MKKILILGLVVLLPVIIFLSFNKDDYYKIDSGEFKGNKIKGVTKEDSDRIDSIVNDENTISSYVNYKDDVYLTLTIRTNEEQEMQGVNLSLVKYDEENELLIDVTTDKESDDFFEISKEIMTTGELKEENNLNLKNIDYQKVVEAFNEIDGDLKVINK